MLSDDMSRKEPPHLAEAEDTDGVAPLKERTNTPLKPTCGTPASQVSTAPPTPFQGWSLPDSHLNFEGINFSRLYSVESSAHAPEDEAGKAWTTSDEEEAEANLDCPLESELGRWAQRQVEDVDVSTDGSELGEYEEESSDDVCEGVMIDDPEQITCAGPSAGMPPLQSELGKWAARVVAAEEWLEERLSKEYIVDNTNLKALTVGIAWRLSKHVSHRDRSCDGPHWGSTIVGVDQGDGWVKVGRRYLPFVLDGQPVLIPAAARGNHLARVPGDGENKAFGVDLDGVVHVPSSCMKTRRFPGQPTNRAACLRRLHSRQAERRGEGKVSWLDDCRLCADEGGKVFAFLDLGASFKSDHRRRCRRAAARAVPKQDAPGYIFVINTNGVVQEWLNPGERL